MISITVFIRVPTNGMTNDFIISEYSMLTYNPKKFIYPSSMKKKIINVINQGVINMHNTRNLDLNCVVK